MKKLYFFSYKIYIFSFQKVRGKIFFSKKLKKFQFFILQNVDLFLYGIRGNIFYKKFKIFFVQSAIFFLNGIRGKIIFLKNLAQSIKFFLYGIGGYFSLKIKYVKITKYVLIIMSQFNRYAKTSKLDRAINTYIIKY